MLFLQRNAAPESIPQRSFQLTSARSRMPAKTSSPISTHIIHGFSLLLAFAVLPSASVAKWKYFRTGNQADLVTKASAGFALMGGGKQDPALRYLCEHANGGDFLVLRANTEDDYAKKVDEEIKAICPLNSAATIVFDDRQDSDDPKLLAIIAQAEVIFFAGGDQSNYVRFWQDTPSTTTSPPESPSAAPAPASPFSANSLLPPSSIPFIPPKPSPIPMAIKSRFPAISCASPSSLRQSRIRISPSATAWAVFSSLWLVF
jgi:hypothetical protein